MTKANTVRVRLDLYYVVRDTPKDIERAEKALYTLLDDDVLPRIQNYISLEENEGNEPIDDLSWVDDNDGGDECGGGE